MLYLLQYALGPKKYRTYRLAAQLSVCFAIDRYPRPQELERQFSVTFNRTRRGTLYARLTLGEVVSHQPAAKGSCH